MKLKMTLQSVPTLQLIPEAESLQISSYSMRLLKVLPKTWLKMWLKM